jgi:8-oxo-dGTP pyrophosphatase MutT (NUDIX family)
LNAPHDRDEIEEERLYPTRTVVVALLENTSHEVLLVRTHRLPNRWQPVGGGVDAEDKSLLQAISREVAEECGITIPPESFNHIFKAPYDFGTGTVHFYTAALPDSSGLKMDSKELCDWAWFSLDAAARLPMYPATEACIQYLKKTLKDQSQT